MEIKKAWLLLAAALLFSSPSHAQVARQEKLPQGHLFLAPGNASPLEEEKPFRVYGFVGFGGGTQKETDGVEYGVDSEATELGADFGRRAAVFSLGRSSATTTWETTSQGVKYESRNELSRAGGRVTFLRGGSFVVAGQIFRVEEERFVEASNAASRVTANVGFQYFDFALGGQYRFSELLTGGVSISPAVSEEKGYDSALAGTAARSGHGLRFQGGVGYNEMLYGLGADLIIESENADSRTAGLTRLNLSGEYVLREFSVTGGLDYFKKEALVDGGQYLIPESRGVLFSMSIRSDLGAAVAGLEMKTLQQAASDFGDETADAARFDTFSLTSFFATVAVDF